MATKYIKTIDNKIIVFSASFNHSHFRNFEPVTAGFVNFTTDDLGNPTCECYGQSVSLDFMQSNPVEDSKLANIQILGPFL